MLFKAAICAAIIAAPAFADPVINCDDAAAYSGATMFAVSVMQGLAGSCAKDMTQPACADFIAQIATHEPDDGNAADAFAKFMSEQCPGRIKTKP